MFGRGPRNIRMMVSLLLESIPPNFHLRKISTTYAGRQRTCVSTIRSQWITTTQYGADLTTNIGRHSILPMRKGRFGISNLEKVNQKLLAEAGVASTRRELVSVDPNGAEAQADWKHLGSGENYLGYERTENFALSAARDKPRVYSAPKHLDLNYWGLSGDWTIGKEATLLNQPGGSIVCRFHSRDLHLVMGPASLGSSVRFRVSIDGRRPGNAHGVDLDDEGNGTVKESRMYQLLRQPSPITDRQFEIEFLDPGVEAFSFTFG